VTTIVISGSGLHVPPDVISNDELVGAFNRYVETYNDTHAREIAAGERPALLPSSSEFILKASGIENRHVVDKAGVLDPTRMRPRIPERGNDQLSVQAEMAVAACRQALTAADKTPADIDAVIVACSNLQRAYPAVAIEVQAALGIRGYAFDMNVACSSATFGIEQAVNAVRAGTAGAVLVVSPEICSAHLDFRDRDCHFIFGDVASAVVVERAATATSKTRFEILGSRLATSFSSNIRNNFGFLNHCDDAGVGQRDKLFMQEGRKVFKDVCPMVADHIRSHLTAIGLVPADVQRFWLHQANLAMNQLIVRRLLERDATASDAPVILDEYANTSSAGSIIAFHQHSDDLAPGAVGVIASFGAGYSVGSVILRRLDGAPVSA
jgi:beta-ketodecanoyl-[acyl-carrier-protein] synthase